MKTRAILFITITLTSYATLAAGAATPVTAIELIDKYTQALDSLRSTIIKAETRDDYEFAFEVDWVDPFVRGTRGVGKRLLSRAEYRMDGVRFHARVYNWGYLSSREPSVPEEQANYVCKNWDGTQFYQHTRKINSPTLPGSVTLQKPAMNYQLWPRIPPTAYLMGYNLVSDERLDYILRRAKSISLHPKNEMIGRSECYVLDAKTDNGTISLWMDPVHGFHPVQVECVLAEGDLDYDTRLQKGARRISRLENVDFKQVAGVWVPVEADVALRKDFGGGNNFVNSRYHFRATEVVLNPDHKTLGSFDTPFDSPKNDPELKNGTRIITDGAQSVWQDGKAIPYRGRLR